jgi:predicted metal-dependent HD superfamily phosphohydrolase
VFYHDIVLDVFRSDNEEQSAAWAERVMLSIGVNSPRIDRCKRHILATKGHGVNADPDTNIFTDADLSILGSDSATYETYSKQIRQEYMRYDENTYKTSRKKILETFFRSPFIYKTESFKMKFEEQARENIEKELKTLT